MGDISAGLEDMKLDGTLFAKVKFYVSGEADPKVLSLLQEGGAERSNYFSDFVTHLIAGSDALENDISEAKDLYEIPAVTQDWVLYSVKCKKLLPTIYFSAEENQLFSSVKACISQVSRADSKAIWAMITFQGGKCQLRLDHTCTHLITGKASGDKYENALKHQILIVTPDWLTECCKQRSLVSETEFHPKFLVNPLSNNSTALITGFIDEEAGDNSVQEETSNNKVILEQLKQRMPWNQKPQPAVTSQANSQNQNITSSSSPSLTVTNSLSVSSANISDQSSKQQVPPQKQQQQQQQMSQPQLQQIPQVQQQQQFAQSQQRQPQPQLLSQQQQQQLSQQQLPQQQQQQLTQQQQLPQQQQLSQQIQQQQQAPVPQQQQPQLPVQQQQLPVQQQQFSWTSTNTVAQPSASVPVSSVQNSAQQSGWNSSGVQNNMLSMKSPTQQEVSSTQMVNSQGIHQPQQQQLLNQQQEMIQMSSQQPQMSQQPVLSQQQQVNNQLLQQQLSTQQQQQQQLNPQQQLVQQQQMLPRQQIIAPQQIVSQQQIQIQQQMVSQQQITSQQQISPQQQMVQQHMGGQIAPQQIIQQQQMTQQQIIPQQQVPAQQIGPQQQLSAQQQLVLQQKQQMMSQQIHLNQQQPQQIGLQQPIQNQVPKQQQQQQQQQISPEQRQMMLIKQQQIQQISQQLQQSAPQGSQFVIRSEGPMQQSQTQIIGQNQQSFMVQRDPQWQQQQYQLQIQRQQQQQQIPGQQRPGAQWPQQLTQPPRQLIQLDAQTHQHLQQLDPQQRSQFIQKLQKDPKAFMLRGQGRQGSIVIRSPGKPGQPGIQWVSQPRTQIIGPQIAAATGQKPGQLHQIVQQQPPALTPINSSNQVIVQTSQTNQGPQVGQNPPFQQGQPLTQQQLAQLQLQKQQQIVRMQQLQQLQQQQQQQQQQLPQQQSQQVVQQDPSLTGITGNAQLPADQQLVVNAKTKTALANMLTNRLQGGAVEGSAAGQLRLMTAQHRPPPPASQDPQLLAAYQRRTLGNITNGAPPAGPGPVKMQGPVTAAQQPKPQFYGHNPNLKLPPDLFLLGCIFVIVEYDVQSPKEVAEWIQVIDKHGGEIEPQYCPRATHVLSITQKHPTVVQALREGKRCVTAYWLSDTIMKQQVLPPWHALHYPTPFSVNDGPCSKQIVSISGFEGEERAKVKFMLDSLGAKFTKYFSRHNTLLVCKKLEGPKYKRAREWQTVVVNAQWLNELLCGQMTALHQPEAPKYQQYNSASPCRLDYSLVPHLMAAWKMPINISQESYDRIKQVGQGPNAMRKNKKAKLDVPLLDKDAHLSGLDEPITISNPNPPTPENQPRILFSGINPKNHVKRIRELGGTLAASWKDATHLVMNSPLRTVKLLCCLSRCKYIVSLQWLLDCFTQNTFVDESPYALGDAEFEKNFSCNIQKALASPNRGNILKGKTFYVTPGVIPSPSAMADIIESAGGTLEKTRRSLAQIKEMNSDGKLDYIIIAVENDLHLLADVIRAEINVFSAEILLGAIAKQSFELETSPSAPS